MTLFGWCFFAGLAALVCFGVYIALRSNNSNPEG